MDITIEWVEDEGAYIVRQDDDFIGDFMSLEQAGAFALSVSALNSNSSGVELISVQPE